MTVQPTCWCGSDALVNFAPSYRRCTECGTLVSDHQPAEPVLRVSDEERDFYGRAYWFSHQEDDLNHDTIEVRARLDMPERCLHWLRTYLRYQEPPARVLELGCGHGGFVGLLNWLAFEATGLELSPWVAAYGERTFGVRVLAGPLEDQAIPPASLDSVVLMDVLEHLPDPVGTMRRAMALVKPDGFLLIQTPRAPSSSTYEELQAAGDRFLELLKADEHLYLFTRDSMQRLFRQLGAEHVIFEPPIFPWYDMFAVVSRQSLSPRPWPAVEAALLSSPNGRFALALLDAGQRADSLEQRLAEAETDRAARLVAIERLQAELDVSNADRAARLVAIERLQAALEVSDADRAARLQAVETLHVRLEESEADRAARLVVIEELGRRLADMNEELNHARQRLAVSSGGNFDPRG